MLPTCRHCHARPISEARGLCHGCYGVLEIRNLYPTSTGCYCRRPLAHGNESLPLADAPTAERPGSEEKIDVMQARAAAGRAVFHPGDWRGE